MFVGNHWLRGSAKRVTSDPIIVLVLFIVVSVIEESIRRRLAAIFGDAFLEETSLVILAAVLRRGYLIKLEWRSVPLLTKKGPVNACEEGILLDLSNSWALFGLLVEHAQQDALGRLGEVVGDLQLALTDILVEDVDVVVVEGWNAHEHLVEDDSDLIHVA